LLTRRTRCTDVAHDINIIDIIDIIDIIEDQTFNLLSIIERVVHELLAYSLRQPSSHFFGAGGGAAAAAPERRGSRITHEGRHHPDLPRATGYGNCVPMLRLAFQSKLVVVQMGKDEKMSQCLYLSNTL
jgi:hypothetical protein